MKDRAYTYAQKKYDDYNTKRISLKLNLKTDYDIITWLDIQENKQKSIKDLIRNRIDDLKNERIKTFHRTNKVKVHPGRMTLDERLNYCKKQWKTANSIVIGTPGSGKSYGIKKEIEETLNDPKKRIFILDTTGEYSYWAKDFKDADIKVLKIGQDDFHINLLDRKIIADTPPYDLPSSLFRYISIYRKKYVDGFLLTDFLDDFYSWNKRKSKPLTFDSFLEYIKEEQIRKDNSDKYADYEDIIESLKKYAPILNDTNFAGYDLNAKVLIYDISEMNYYSFKESTKEEPLIPGMIIGAYIGFNCLEQFLYANADNDIQKIAYIEDFGSYFKEECIQDYLLNFSDINNCTAYTLVAQDIKDIPRYVAYKNPYTIIYNQFETINNTYEDIFNVKITGDFCGLGVGTCYTVNTLDYCD